MTIEVGSGETIGQAEELIENYSDRYFKNGPGHWSKRADDLEARFHAGTITFAEYVVEAGPLFLELIKAIGESRPDSTLDG